MATGLGIDIGAQWIKVVQVRCSGQQITVTGALKLPREIGDASPEGAAGDDLSVPPNLGQELARAGLNRSGTLGITGRGMVLKYLTTPPMPPDKLRRLIDMQLGERMVPGRKEEGAPSVTYDYRLLNVPTGLSGDLVIMAAVAKNDFLHGAFNALKSTGVSVRQTAPSAFGLAQAYLRTQKVPKDETVVLVDVGHESLEVAILAEEQIYFARSGPGGGKKFTDALDKLLNLGAKETESFKHNRARLQPGGTKLESRQDLQFQNALKEGADGIASAIRSSVMYCRTQAKLPKLDYQRVFLCGGGARLAGLREYLEDKIKRPVQVLDLYTGLDLRKLDAQSAQCFEGEIPDMAVALGLAVVDADPAAYCLRLVPETLSKKRVFWGKTVFAAAAVVIALASLVPPYFNAQKSLNEAATAREEFEHRVEDARLLKKQFKKEVEDTVGVTQRYAYYARQPRPGRVLLDLFAHLRADAPPGVTFVYLGPDEGEGAYGNQKGMSERVFDEPLQSVIVRGYYDTDRVKDYNESIKSLFTKLRAVPGVRRPESDPFFNDGEMALEPGFKGFQFRVHFADPHRPYAPDTEPPAPAAPAPAKQGKSGKQAQVPAAPAASKRGT